jgi:hypothetical protein
MWQNEDGKQYSISVKPNGDRFWYLNNKLHREKGAAIELATGGRAYYYEGNKIACSSQKEFEKIIGLKKEAQTIQIYDVKIAANVPATLTFRVNAKSPEEALQKTKTMSPNSVQYKLPARKNIKATIYQAGTSLVKLVKNMLGN